MFCRQVKTIISNYEAKGDWTFLYIGENPDRWAKDTGMNANYAIAYNHNAQRANFISAGSTVSQFRRQAERQPRSLTLEVSDPK